MIKFDEMVMNEWLGFNELETGYDARLRDLVDAALRKLAEPKHIESFVSALWPARKLKIEFWVQANDIFVEIQLFWLQLSHYASATRNAMGEFYCERKQNDKMKICERTVINYINTSRVRVCVSLNFWHMPRGDRDRMFNILHFPLFYSTTSTRSGKFS